MRGLLLSQRLQKREKRTTVDRALWKTVSKSGAEAPSIDDHLPAYAVSTYHVSGYNQYHTGLTSGSYFGISTGKAAPAFAGYRKV